MIIRQIWFHRTKDSKPEKGIAIYRSLLDEYRSPLMADSLLSKDEKFVIIFDLELKSVESIHKWYPCRDNIIFISDLIAIEITE